MLIAVPEYWREYSRSAGKKPNKEGLRKQVGSSKNVARKFFWTALEQGVPDLLTAVETGTKSWYETGWGKLVNRTARDSLEVACPSGTPRQIRAFSKAAQVLSPSVRMGRETSQAEAQRTVEFLERIREDRGALAALRSSWIPARETQAWPVLAQIGRLDNRTKQNIAAFYALHPVHTHDREGGNMGAICATLAGQYSTFDLRFRRLLACERGELPLHLRRVIMAAAASNLPIEYTELYRDIQFWSDWVRRRWAKNYYRRYQPTAEREGRCT